MRAFRDPQPDGPARGAKVSKLHRQRRALMKLLEKAEEKERHRIARELHDTTAQDLVAIDLNLHRIGRSCIEPRDRALFSETCDLLKRAQREIRTMSFLLHPPPVAEGGLAWALERLVDEFSKRTGLQTRLETDLSGRLSEEVETNLYRVVQEALINVHRHADAGQAIVRCLRSDDAITVEIEDDGIGIDSGGALRPGVGLRTIVERVREMGGTLSLVPLFPGTLVRIALPAPSQGELQFATAASGVRSRTEVMFDASRPLRDEMDRTRTLVKRERARLSSRLRFLEPSPGRAVADEPAPHAPLPSH